MTKIADVVTLDRIGTGALIRDKNRTQWWCIGGEHFWIKEEEATVITYTAIGGKVELGETIAEATLRELKEEAGVIGKIISAPQTLVCDLDKDEGDVVELDEVITPVLIYNSKEKGFSVATFWVSVDCHQMKPGSEIPALVRIPNKMLRREDMPLQMLEANGGEIISCIPLPKNSFIRPIGSAWIWAGLSSCLRRKLEPQ